MLSKKIRERFYKEEVLFILYRRILSNIDIYTTSRKIQEFIRKKIILWLSCVLLVCYRMDNPELYFNVGVTTLKMEFVLQAIVPRVV